MSRTSEYIEKYSAYACEQMRRYGIPASITLAQGLIESANGRSTLARTANNHFGVKGTFNGNYVLANDDKPNEQFKKYDNVGQSYEDHSKVLMRDRYQKYVKNLAANDYRGWAEGIKKGGYATDKNYVSTLVSVIEKNNLQQYDQKVLAEKGTVKTQSQGCLSNMLAQAAQDTPAVKQESGQSNTASLLGNDVASSLANGESQGMLDTLMQMLMTMLMMSMQAENKTKAEQVQAMGKATVNRKIDLSGFVPNLKSAALTLNYKGGVVLTTSDGKQEYSRELTSAEKSRLSQIINSQEEDAAKKLKIGNFVYAQTFSMQASRNYEQIESQQQTQLVAQHR